MGTGSRRVIIVTGAAGGLGAATVATLREEPATTVVAVDRSPLQGDDGESAGVDITDAAAVRHLVEQTLDKHGRLDGVAHCAGIFHQSHAPLHLMEDSAWHETISVNLTGGFNVAKATLPSLMESQGSLTLVSSISSTFAQPGGAAYAASKAGLVGLVNGIALEYGPRGVRCNSVLPGYMDTPMAGPLLTRPHLRAGIESEIPLGRVADPAEVAAVVAFTLSPAASYLNGHALTVDGAAHLTSMTSRRDIERMWSRHTT